MASSATKKESSITLQYHSEEWELIFKARYGIDGEERMEVDNEPGIHLVPDNEQLLITKVDEHEGTSTFSYRSDPASDLISVSECEKINNFVGVHPQRCWLLSVLWLLSELAVKQFGQQG
ncbi:uncharacterized protein [Pocillopora verrucosa]|uniref:uncharacterized protein isoform X2 n=1 Tax=Pocillopora verrucosa TaxID=203993 RepID=UPI00333E4994